MKNSDKTNKLLKKWFNKWNVPDSKRTDYETVDNWLNQLMSNIYKDEQLNLVDDYWINYIVLKTDLVDKKRAFNIVYNEFDDIGLQTTGE